MKTKYDEYLEAKGIVNNAETWQALPDSKNKYKDSKFEISPAHCEIRITRCGQHHAGSDNYWDPPRELGQAIADMLNTKYGKEFIERAIQLLRDRETKALKGCKEFVSKVQAEIAKAEGK